MKTLQICGLCVIALVAAGLIGWNQRARAADQPAAQQWQGFPRISPFSALRWTPEVKVNGAWYGLVSINDLSVDDIHDYCKSIHDSDWQKHFGEDLVEILTNMGHAPGNTVDLKVKDLSTGETKTLPGVPMTEDNRQAILEASKL